MSSISHFLLVQRDDIDFTLKLVDRKISNFRAQNGTKEHPARSCREIKLDHPNFESGLYCFSFVTLLVLFTCRCKITQFVTTQKRLHKCMKQPVTRFSTLLSACIVNTVKWLGNLAKFFVVWLCRPFWGLTLHINLAKHKKWLCVFIHVQLTNRSIAIT